MWLIKQLAEILVMMNEEERREILMGEFTEAIGLSESFVLKFENHLQKLTVTQQDELITRLKKGLREQYVNVISQKSVKSVIPASLNSLEKSTALALPQNKQALFVRWVTYLKEQGTKAVGKQRLDVLFAVFDTVDESALNAEMDYRINLGHLGLVFKGEDNSSSGQTGSSQKFLSKISEQSKRIGQELADKHKKPE